MLLTSREPLISSQQDRITFEQFMEIVKKLTVDLKVAVQKQEQKT